MINHWTPERRSRPALAIHRWRPWERSTGLRSAAGKAAASLNASKGGHRKALREEMRVFRGLLEAWTKLENQA